MNGNAVVANSTMEEIADAIREKTGTSGGMKPYEMPDMIRSIPSGGGGGVVEVSDVAGLALLMEEVNNGDSKADVTYVLTNDIDFDGAEWPGIGKANNNGDYTQNVSFSGTFDGRGHTIRNFYFAINGKDHSKNPNTYRGFFNSVSGGTIRNLTLDCNGFQNVSAGQKVGGAVCVGMMYAGTVEDVTVSGCITPKGTYPTHNVAGVCACVLVDDNFASSTSFIRRCRSSVVLELNYTKAGGIIAFTSADATSKGWGRVVMDGCVNTGPITSSYASPVAGTGGGFGGLVGWTGIGAGIYFTDCENTGTISADQVNDNASGSLVGYASHTINFFGENRGQAGIKIVGTPSDYGWGDNTNKNSVVCVTERGGMWYVSYMRTYYGNTGAFYLHPHQIYTVLPGGGFDARAKLGEGETIGFDLRLAPEVTPSVTELDAGLTISITSVGTVRLYHASSGTKPVM